MSLDFVRSDQASRVTHLVDHPEPGGPSHLDGTDRE